jgi:type IV secretion system protein VirB9
MPRRSLLLTPVLLAPLALAAAGCVDSAAPTSLALPPEFVTGPAEPVPAPPSEARPLVAAPKPGNGRPARTVTPHTVDAVTVFPYQDGKVYPIAVSPGYLTVLLLEPGEQMPGKAAIGDPDPARWLVEKTTAGSAKGPVVALLIKPGAAGISTNLFVPTSRRVYQLDVTSYARRAMDMVQWRYPERSLGMPEPVAAEVPFDPALLNRNYRIEVARGSRPRWTPVAAFDLGARSYVEFPANIGEVSAPALFVLDDGLAQPAPFRPRGRFYEIDRTFGAAELRQGDTVVRITRSAG